MALRCGLDGNLSATLRPLCACHRAGWGGFGFAIACDRHGRFSSLQTMNRARPRIRVQQHQQLSAQPGSDPWSWNEVKVSDTLSMAVLPMCWWSRSRTAGRALAAQISDIELKLLDIAGKFLWVRAATCIQLLLPCASLCELSSCRARLALVSVCRVKASRLDDIKALCKSII